MFQNDKSEENTFFNGTLKMIILDKNHPDINKVLLLYYSAFPKNELLYVLKLQNILNLEY